jgi:hypothetical protein
MWNSGRVDDCVESVRDCLVDWKSEYKSVHNNVQNIKGVCTSEKAKNREANVCARVEECEKNLC